MYYLIIESPLVGFVGQIWMQIILFHWHCVTLWHCASLTHVGYLVVQHRRVISACTASEGDVWFVLPLFLHFIGIREIQWFWPQSATSSGDLISLWSIVEILGLVLEMPGGNRDGIGFLVGAARCHFDATLMPHLMPLCLTLMALMWSALANSYWPARCNLRCVDLKKLFCHGNRWSPGLGSSCCQWCGAAAINFCIWLM